MRKKGLFVAILLLLMFGGCNGASQSEDWILPTMDPTVTEQNNGTTEQKDDVTGKEDKAGDAAGTEEEDEKGTLGGLYPDFMSYVDKSKHAMDQNQADSVAIIVEAACIEAQIQGMVFPVEPIRFRYTNELDQLDDSYGLLKGAIRDLMGDDVIELKVEGNYLMVEIVKEDDGRTKVEVELLNE